MVSRRTAHLPPAPGAVRRRLRSSLPALTLGLTALALAVPTTLPASADPGSPTTPTANDTGSGHHSTASTGTKTQHLTAAAKKAGLEPGNATMGWRERGVERSAPERRTGRLRYGAAIALSESPGFTPKGVLGVDVSSYQGKVKWARWTDRDKDFAFIKATEGTSYKNPYFKNQYRGSSKAGMIRGAYHFASPNGKAGWKQARYFIKNGGGWTADGRTLPGVLDIEYNPYGSTCYGVSKKKMVSWIHSFTREYFKQTGRHAAIYTTTDWWKRCTGNDTSFKKNPLWIARYGTKKPGTLPKGWTTATFWQYSSNPIDQDVFPGKLKKLKALASTKAKVAAS